MTIISIIAYIIIAIVLHIITTKYELFGYEKNITIYPYKGFGWECQENQDFFYQCAFFIWPITIAIMIIINLIKLIYKSFILLYNFLYNMFPNKKENKQ